MADVLDQVARGLTWGTIVDERGGAISKDAIAERTTMKYLRTYAGPDGESHFEEVEPPLTPRVAGPRSTAIVLTATTGASTETAALWLRSAPIPAEHLTFSRSRAGTFREPGPSRHRLFIFTIEGENEVQTSDGETRRLGPGSVWLIDDTSGKGHSVRTWDTSDWLWVAVVLPD